MNISKIVLSSVIISALFLTGCVQSKTVEEVTPQPEIFSEILVVDENHEIYQSPASHPRNFSIEYPAQEDGVIVSKVFQQRSTGLTYFLDVTSLQDHQPVERILLTSILIPGYDGAEAILDKSMDNAMIIAADAVLQDYDYAGEVVQSGRRQFLGQDVYALELNAYPVTEDSTEASSILLVVGFPPQQLGEDDGLILIMQADAELSDIDTWDDFETSGLMGEMLQTLIVPQ